jgi:GT2 family glycosyltransferase/tetratricopeptide (TPR) repeat protein/glycosyltransferase involved in cell wall biosynthesis
MIGTDRSVELEQCTVGELPIQIFKTESSRIDEWLPGEPEAMLAAFERIVDDFRPDVLLTYGGDPITRQMWRVARAGWRARRRTPVVFWLHNFAYDDARCFEDVDHVIVPSEFSRRWYRERLGMECRVLPYLIDWERVTVRDQSSEVRGQQEQVSGNRWSVDGATDAQRSAVNDQRFVSDAQRFVTLVNPQPTKGLVVFARIAEQLQRRRPDIPILVVESRGHANWLEQVPIDLSWCQNLHAMANTCDPRDFYRVTKLILVPSLWNESFGLVAAEAMINGIPVLASDRGALPEVIGNRLSVIGGEPTHSGGFLYHIPERYAPDTAIVPTVQEVEPWVETIIRLWDDGQLYRECSKKAKQHAQRWHPDVVLPLYVEFFQALNVERRALSEQSYVRLNAQPSTLSLPARHTSIVIVTHNQFEFTRICVESIRKYTAEPYELIIIDNGSTDETVEYLKGLGLRVEGRGPKEGRDRRQEGYLPVRVQIVSNAFNRGFPAAANQGIQAATGQQMVLINNDTVVTAGWLTRLLRALESDPTVGMVGPVSNFVSGAQQIDVPYQGSGFGVQGSGGVEGSALSVQGSENSSLNAVEEFARGWAEANTGRIQETDRLVGFCLLIKREVVEKIGLLDERFGIGNFEDDDYCLRAREAGYRLVIERDAFVHHFGGATFIGAKVDHGAVMRENERLFLEKWAERVQGSGFRVQQAEAERVQEREEVIGDRLSVIGETDAPGTGQVTGERWSVDGGYDAQRSPLNAQRSDNPQSKILNTKSLDTRHASPATVSLCMIARDNERTIGAALEVIRRYVDDIVVVDTGSTDRTPEIAASLGARVFHFPWCDDFSAARNESIRHALGDWIFWMDTDDSMDEENARKVPEVVSGVIPRDIMGFLMKVRCPSSGRNGDQGAIEVDQVKLFRNLPELRFEGRIHEQILMAIRRAGGTVAWTDIFVVHSGSDQSPEGRAKKIERDLRILDLEYKERPDHPFTLFNLGMTYAEAGEHDKAIGFLWQSIGRAGEEDSHLAKTYALLVSSYRQLARQAAAWETCIKGMKQFPEDLELRFQQAAMHYGSGRLREAARGYEELRALKTSRHLSSVDRGLQGYRSSHNLAGIYAELGEFASAVSLWRDVVQEAPWFAPAWQGLINLLLRQGKTDEALRCAEMLESQHEMAGDASRLRRSVLVNRGEFQTVRDELDRGIEQHPDDLELLEERCRLLFEHFPPSEAEAGFRALLAHDPANAAGHHNLGSVLYKLGRFEEAAAAYRRSIELRPDSASTYLHLGYALREANNVAEAVGAWNKALEIQPGEPLATAALRDVGS